jgi:hypothetical protein
MKNRGVHPQSILRRRIASLSNVPNDPEQLATVLVRQFPGDYARMGQRVLKELVKVALQDREKELGKGKGKKRAREEASDSDDSDDDSDSDASSSGSDGSDGSSSDGSSGSESLPSVSSGSESTEGMQKRGFTIDKRTGAAVPLVTVPRKVSNGLNNSLALAYSAQNNSSNGGTAAPAPQPASASSGPSSPALPTSVAGMSFSAVAAMATPVQPAAPIQTPQTKVRIEDFFLIYACLCTCSDRGIRER